MFTDLKLQREKKLQMQQRSLALKSSDYRERAEDVVNVDGQDHAEDAAKRTAAGEPALGEPRKAEEGGEKKKKNKKKKNKKKKGQEDGPSADNTTLLTQAEKFNKEVENVLKQEKLDADHDSEEDAVAKAAPQQHLIASRRPANTSPVQEAKLDQSDDEKYFDDHFYMQDVDHADIELQFDE